MFLRVSSPDLQGPQIQTEQDRKGGVREPETQSADEGTDPTWTLSQCPGSKVSPSWAQCPADKSQTACPAAGRGRRAGQHCAAPGTCDIQGPAEPPPSTEEQTMPGSAEMNWSSVSRKARSRPLAGAVPAQEGKEPDPKSHSPQGGGGYLGCYLVARKTFQHLRHWGPRAFPEQGWFLISQQSVAPRDQQ